MSESEARKDPTSHFIASIITSCIAIGLIWWSFNIEEVFADSVPYFLWFIAATCIIAAIGGFFNWWIVIRKPSKENGWFFKHLGVDGREVTGYSSIHFNLKGLYYATSEAQSLISDLKEGQYCTLRYDWYNSEDSYAMIVMYANTPIGYVDSSCSEKVYSLFRSRSFESCKIVKRIEESGRSPILTLQLIFTDNEGKEPYCGLMGDVRWQIIDTTHFNGEVTDRFIQNYKTLELIDMQCELYGLSCVDEESNQDGYYQMIEDNAYLINFITAYNCGEIQDGSEKTRYLRHISAARTFGNNKILNKRIKYYIEANQLKFTL